MSKQFAIQKVYTHLEYPISLNTEMKYDMRESKKKIHQK